MNLQPVVKCPHCEQLIVVESVNCAIFRCAIYKSTMQQLNPHAPKDLCDRLKDQDQIYGCGKPFKVEWDHEYNQFNAVICEYI